MNAVEQVMQAAQAARWREIYVWLTTNAPDTLAAQMLQLGMTRDRLLTIAHLLPQDGDSVAPPRSWPPDQRAAFEGLPRGVQQYIAKRTAEQERELRRAQNRAAEAEKKLAASEQPHNEPVRDTETSKETKETK
jgi:hypothetical protein